MRHAKSLGIVLAGLVVWSAMDRGAWSADSKPVEKATKAAAGDDLQPPSLDDPTAPVRKMPRPQATKAGSPSAAVSSPALSPRAGKKAESDPQVPPPAKPKPQAAAKPAAAASGAKPVVKTPELKPETKPAGTAKADQASKNEPKGTASNEAKKGASAPAPLTEELQNLRDRVRWALQAYARSPLSTSQHTPGDVILLGWAYGCAMEVQHGNETINGITCLCWNYPCAGFELLKRTPSGPVARLGFGQQAHPGQFLAMLALSRVPKDYPVRIGQEVRKVADLVEAEKGFCRPGVDQPLRLVGLAFYLEPDQRWTNNEGEPWSLGRLVAEELERPLAAASGGTAQRLLGLSCGVRRLAKNKQFVSQGPTSQAVALLKQYHQYAFQVQQGDGSVHPGAFPGGTADPVSPLRVTAQVAHWLTLWLPDSMIRDAHLVRAIEYCTNVLIERQAQWPLANLNGRTLESVTWGLAALSAYDEQVFQPCDAKPGDEKPEAEKPNAEKSGE